MDGSAVGSNICSNPATEKGGAEEQWQVIEYYEFRIYRKKCRVCRQLSLVVLA